MQAPRELGVMNPSPSQLGLGKLGSVELEPVAQGDLNKGTK